MSDRLQSLQVFRRTARCGSFSRAARELALSQASVSRIIAELERALGAQLLTRTTRAVALTDTGSDYLVRIEQVLDALDEADHVARGGGPLRGLLRIGLSASFGVREIIPRLPDFLAQHRELRVDLAVSDSRQDLVQDAIDIAFRLGPLADSTLIARQIARSPRVLAASPEYLAERPSPDRPEDLSAHSLIVGPGAAPPILEFRKGDRLVRVPASGRMTCAANEAATALALAGLGVTVSSFWGIAREFRAGTLVRLLPDWALAPVDLHCVFPPGRAPSPAARACADFFTAALRGPQSGG